MPRTAYEVCARSADVVDPISLEPADQVSHPTLINGDPTRTVYALESLLQMHKNANKNAFKNPILPTAYVQLDAPKALVAVCWDGTDPQERRRARMTENHMFALGLTPGYHFDIHYNSQQMHAQREPLWQWLRRLRAAWGSGVFDHRRAFIALDPNNVEVDYGGNGMDGLERAEAELLALERDIPTRPGALPQMQLQLQHCSEFIDAFLVHEVQRALAHNALYVALEWMKRSHLELKRVVAVLAELAPRHTEVEAALRAHARLYFASRMAYLDALISARADAHIVRAFVRERLEPWIASPHADAEMRTHLSDRLRSIHAIGRV